MPTPSPADAYWASVERSAQGDHRQARLRATELLRLKAQSEKFRELLPDLPEITIDTTASGGRNLGRVDPIGGWGQGLAIQLRESRIDPFNGHQVLGDMERPDTGPDSLIFGYPLLDTAAGETLRKFEADLILLQQMLRAAMHHAAAAGDREAAVDLTSYGGTGRWFTALCNRVWAELAPQSGLPFVPVRNGRIAEVTNDDELTRPLCRLWPAITLREVRNPRPIGDCPGPLKLQGRQEPLVITPEQWQQWCAEQLELERAVDRKLGHLLKGGLKLPEREALAVDDPDDGPGIPMPPAAAAPLAMSSKVTINYDPTEALVAVQALLQRVDEERGTELWPGFLQEACAAAGSAAPATKPEPRNVPDVNDPLLSTVLEPGLHEQLMAWIKTKGDTVTDVLESALEMYFRRMQALEPSMDDPMAAACSPFHLEQEVSHEAFGRGVVIRLFKAAVAVNFNGTKQIVRNDSITPVEPGELPVDEAVVQATEIRNDPDHQPSEPQLRKTNRIHTSPPELIAEVEQLCLRHGGDWSRSISSDLIRRYGLTRQTLHYWKTKTLKQQQSRQAQEVA